MGSCESERWQVNNSETLIRLGAMLVAAALLAQPYVGSIIKSIRASISLIPSRRERDPVRDRMREIAIVLDLSDRLAASGCADGVALCQKLIDTILKSTPQKQSGVKS